MSQRHFNAGPPETMHVEHSGFGNEIMVINVDDFDPKTMKRVNKHGQYINEKGMVIEAPKPSETAPKVVTKPV